ncbi:DUF4885 family protein [Bacillus tequilensis]|uniref:DUF4885 family protein n=1 Tax=Bacillus tequilensis TaxID=227866 RepID=UPI0004645B67|nr:DUF4885 family protein [Bacillus tequilensis]MDR4433067.1 DUF4885 domain-containing protein [Bacillus tequilensis]SPU01500.1 cation efflux system [Bacillus tequilensis]
MRIKDSVKLQHLAQQINKQSYSSIRKKDTVAKQENQFHAYKNSSPVQSSNLKQINYSRESVMSDKNEVAKRYQLANEKTVVDTGEETLIHSRNPYVSESDIEIQILNEKYSRINRINLSKENPIGYIRDKYKNVNSPYFRHDLTNEERQAAYDNETEWLYKGKAQHYNMRDAAFRHVDMSGPNEDDRAKAFQRDVVNQQIGLLFDRQHLTIPKNTKLTFTITPFDYAATVTGTNDQKVIDTIEALLNSGSNSKELFQHIIGSRTDDSTQFEKKTYDKYRVVREIYEKTGYYLGDLHAQNGTYLTEDGRDILDVYREALEKDPLTKDFTLVALSHYGSEVKHLASVGYDTVPDLVLSIHYQNGFLEDAGQSKNYSANNRAWLPSLQLSDR